MFIYNKDGTLTRTVDWKLFSAKNGKYGQVKVSGKTEYIHRIIWEIHNGKIPDGMEIDHINREKSDNRIENLRLVTRLENNQNWFKKFNKTGLSGVYKSPKKEKRKKMFYAEIFHNGKKKRLGRFICPIIAHVAYMNDKRICRGF